MLDIIPYDVCMESAVNDEEGNVHRLLHASAVKQVDSVERCLLDLLRDVRSPARNDVVEETTKKLEVFLSYFDENEDGDLNFGEVWNTLKAYLKLQMFRHSWTRTALDGGSICDALTIEELGKLKDYLDDHHVTMLHFYISGSWCEEEAPMWQAYADSLKDLSLGIVTVDASKGSGIHERFGIEEIPSTVLMKKVSERYPICFTHVGDISAAIILYQSFSDAQRNNYFYGNYSKQGIIYNNIHHSYSVFRYEKKNANYSLDAFTRGHHCSLEVFTHMLLYIMFICMLIFFRRFERSVRNAQC